MQGGHVSQKSGDIIIPVQIDENSPVEFVTQNEAAKIITTEVEKRNEQFQNSSDDEKEQIIANIITNHLSRDPSVLDKEVVQCTLNKGIFNILRTFYIPESIAKTIASWVGWFLRGSASITYTFLKTSALYLLNNYQRILLLLFVYFVIYANVTLPLTSVVIKYNNALLAGASETTASVSGLLGFIVRATVFVSTGFVIVPLMYLITQFSLFYSAIGMGSIIVKYLLELREKISAIAAGCMVEGGDVELAKSPLTRKRIEKQVDNALQDLNNTAALIEGAKQSRTLKSISSKMFEEQFLDHIQNTVSTTPVSEITDIANAMTIPEQVTEDQYIQSLVKNSINLVNKEYVEHPEYIQHGLLNKLSSVQLVNMDDSVPQFEILPQHSVNIVGIEENNENNIVQNVSKNISDNLSIVLRSL